MCVAHPFLSLLFSQHHWEGGYGPFLGVCTEMMFYCYMGSRISVSVSTFFGENVRENITASE